MRLRTKLALAAIGVDVCDRAVAVGFVCRRAAAAEDRADVRRTMTLARQVLLMTRQAVETGLRANPPEDRSDEALRAAVDGCVAESDGRCRM